IRRQLGRVADAEDAFRQCIRVCDGLATQFPEQPVYQEELAGAWHNLGILLDEAGQLPTAVPAQEEAVARFRRLRADFPDRPVASDLGAALQALGVLRRQQVRLEEAKQLAREAVEQQQAALRADPANPRFRKALYTHYQSLAGTLAEERDYKEAEKVL